MVGNNYQTTLPRAAFALLIGVIVGPAITIAGNVIFTVIGLVLNHESVPWADFVAYPAVVIFVLGIFSVYAAGLLFVGAPGWWLLHRLGHRGRLQAVGFGMLAAFFVRLTMDTIPTLCLLNSKNSAGDSGGDTMINGELTLHGWIELFSNATITSLVAAAVALIIWQLAYRPASRSS